MVLHLLFHFSPPLNRLFKVSSLKTKPDIFSEVSQIDFLKSLGQCFSAVVCMNHLGALFKKQMLILYGWVGLRFWISNLLMLSVHFEEQDSRTHICQLGHSWPQLA